MLFKILPDNIYIIFQNQIMKAIAIKRLIMYPLVLVLLTVLFVVFVLVVDMQAPQVDVVGFHV